jgi:hypothetical protein
MFGKVDTRLGREFGLAGQYAGLPAFQIINDTHDLVAGLTSRIVTLEYGGEGDVYVNSPAWKAIKEQRAQFVQRVNGLGGDAVKAAELSEEVRIFSEEVLDPFVAVCEGPQDE